MIRYFNSRFFRSFETHFVSNCFANSFRCHCFKH